MTPETVQRMIDGKHIPLMARGTKIEKFFVRYGVTTDRMSAIVRGQGPAVISRLAAGL